VAQPVRARSRWRICSVSCSFRRFRGGYTPSAAPYRITGMNLTGLRLPWFRIASAFRSGQRSLQLVIQVCLLTVGSVPQHFGMAEVLHPRPRR
jgi:hypothetical protein